VGKDYQNQPLLGETASITFGRTERLGLSDWALPIQSARNNTPNMQRNMYTPLLDFDQGVPLNTYIT
jgi:hypothetical protein